MIWDPESPNASCGHYEGHCNACGASIEPGYETEENAKDARFWPPVAALELGLRWLNDRAARRQQGPWIFMQQIHSVACVELGLRWLHDRGSRCDTCGALVASFRHARWCTTGKGTFLDL